MHIVLVTPTFFPLRGGTEQTVYAWASRMSANHEVTILTLTPPGAPAFELLDGRIPVHRLPDSRIKIWEHLVRAFGTFVGLWRLNRKKPIDVLHLGHVYHMGLGTVLFKLLFRKPMVNTLLGCDTFDPIKPVRWYYLPYLAWVMNSAEKVVTMTRHMASSARRQGCRKEISLIPHGSTMFGQHGKISIRQKHGIAEDAAVIFSLQRLHPRKGLTYLIDAAVTVLQRFPQACFVIGGTGPQEAELRQRVAQRGIDRLVIFAGFIPDEEVSSYYEQARLFVLPTLYEGFGVVYVDALAMGLPVVTTANSGGGDDIVTDEVGMLVKPADAAALAEGILSALQRQWSASAIKAYAARYDWDTIVTQYLDMYRSLQRPPRR